MVHVHQTRGQSAVDVFRALFPDAPGRAEAAELAFDRSYRLAVDRSGLAPMPRGSRGAAADPRVRGPGVLHHRAVPGPARSGAGLRSAGGGRSTWCCAPRTRRAATRGPTPCCARCSRLGVTDVRETAYAGGTESGILCGRRAGAQIVAGILTGGHTRDRLQRAGATHLLGSFAELPGVLAAEARAGHRPGCGCGCGPGCGPDGIRGGWRPGLRGEGGRSGGARACWVWDCSRPGSAPGRGLDPRRLRLLRSRRPPDRASAAAPLGQAPTGYP